uniref:Vps53 N-terminal domain-containing protein n=1 Tax=Romanomermis culicivorax TaxID=13658 RepID=A0A915IDW9_ROMCU
MSENTLPVSSSYNEQQVESILFEIDNVSSSKSTSISNICDKNSLNIGMTIKDNDSFPDIVEKAMAGIINDEDPFAQADFDVTSYVNQLFPTEQSLGSIDDVMTRLKSEVQNVDSEIADIVQCQSTASLDGQKAVFDAKAAIQDLFSQVREIKAKTEMSESMVKEITRDIKQLDIAKKNLTSSITTLNHLHMLLSGVELLQSYARTKDYNQVANLLPGISTVLEHFDKYLTIEKIKNLSCQVRDVRRQLTDQIVVDFKDYFSNPFVAGQPLNKKYTGSNMVDVCHVISVLDAPIKNELIAWFLQQQLAEYFVLFDDTQDSAWLDKLDESHKELRNHKAVKLDSKHLLRNHIEYIYKMIN